MDRNKSATWIALAAMLFSTGNLRQVTAQRMGDALRAVMFNRRPEPPTANKWTKHSKCTNFWFFGEIVHGGLSRIFADGLGKMTFTAPANNVGEPEVEQSWHEVQGRRKERALQTLQDSGMRFAIRVMALVRPDDSPLLHAFLISYCSHPQARRSERHDTNCHVFWFGRQSLRSEPSFLAKLRQSVGRKVGATIV